MPGMLTPPPAPTAAEAALRRPGVLELWADSANAFGRQLRPIIFGMCLKDQDASH
jgi:hypothetical protein